MWENILKGLTPRGRKLVDSVITTTPKSINTILADIFKEIDKVNKNSIDRDKEISNENKSLSTDIWKEFGKTRDLIGELSKLITILQKENELQTIMIEELKASNNPLGG